MKLVETVQKLVRPIGLMASVAALAGFLYLIAQAWDATEFRRLVELHWGTLLLSVLAYCVAYVPMVAAWIDLANAAGANSSRSVLARILLVTQIGKYLPGNVAQFVGRAYFARRYGISLASTGGAIVLELAGILAASGLLASAAMVLGIVGQQSNAVHAIVWIAGITAATTFLAFGWIMRSKGGRTVAYSVLRSIGCYAVVLALLAVVNVLLVSAFSGLTSGALAGQVAAAFVLSWLIGFVTPGSPAGIGLRELSFITLLSGTVNDEVLLLTAAGFRIVTIVGDLIAWSVGVALPTPRDNVSAPDPLPF